MNTDSNLKQLLVRTCPVTAFTRQVELLSVPSKVNFNMRFYGEAEP
jgi:hypothetical protein